MTQLYRHFDAENQLLYVGISLHAVARLAQHNLNSAWASQIARVDVENFETREDAIRAEIAAIRSENPLHNLNHKIRTEPPPRIAPPTTSFSGVAEGEMGLAYGGGWLPADLAADIDSLADEYEAEVRRRVKAHRDDVERIAETELPRGRPPKA